MKTYRWISYAVWLVSLAALGIAIFPMRATSSSCWEMGMSMAVLISLAALMTYLLLACPPGSGRRYCSERLLTNIPYFIPQRHREGIMGDISEDCHELREMGSSEWRTRVYAIRQAARAAIRSWPTALMEALRRVWSIK